MHDMFSPPEYVYDSISGYLLSIDDFIWIESCRLSESLYYQYLKIRKKRKFKNKG